MTFLWSLAAAAALCGVCAFFEWWFGSTSEIKVTLNGWQGSLTGWRADLAVLPFVTLCIWGAFR